MSIRSLDAWKQLETHRDELHGVHLRTLFAQEPGRFERYSLTLDDLLVDYSKQRVTTDTMRLLTALAQATGVETLRDQMFAGAPINGAILSPTVALSSHQPSPHARTPRVAHKSAKSRNLS